MPEAPWGRQTVPFKTSTQSGAGGRLLQSHGRLDGVRKFVTSGGILPRTSPKLCITPCLYGSLAAQTARSLPAAQETRVQSLGCEDPREKKMATGSRILAWKIPWVAEPAGLQSTRSQSRTQLSHFTLLYPVYADSFSPVISQLHVELKGWVMITKSQCPHSRHRTL